MYVGMGGSYNMMTARFYDIFINLANAPGFVIDAGYRSGGPFRYGIRYWASSHKGESPLFQQNRFCFKGVEGYGRLLFARKRRLRPYFLLGYAILSLRSENKEGYRGMGYSFALGVEYWLSGRWTVSTEFDVRYVDYNGIRIQSQERRTGMTNNGTMLSIKLLTLTRHF